MPCTMVASSEQCRRHAAGAVSTVLSFSDDGVVQTVLKEIRKGDDDKRTGLKPPLVSLKNEKTKITSGLLLFVALFRVPSRS